MNLRFVAASELRDLESRPPFDGRGLMWSYKSGPRSAAAGPV